MSSALQIIQESVLACTLSVPGILSSKAVPPQELMKPKPNTKDELWVVALPDKFPGCVVSLNEDEVAVADQNQSGNSTWVQYRVPIYVAMCVMSDGTTREGARYLAWTMGETLLKALLIMVPAPFDPDGGISCSWPLEPDAFSPIVVDSNTHGLLFKVWARYEMESLR